MFGNKLRFAREERFINLDTSITDDRPIDDDLIACMENQDVIHDNLPRIELLLSPVTHDRRLRACEQCNSVQGALSAYLLDETNHQVKRDDAHRNKRIKVLPYEHQGKPDGKENDIDGSKHILPYNLKVGSACCWWRHTA